MASSTLRSLSVILLLTLIDTMSASPLPPLHERQTLAQQTADAANAPHGINHAGKIVLLVFGPLGGIMFIWTAWYVCIGDCIKRSKEKKRLKKEEERNKLQEGVSGGWELETELRRIQKSQRGNVWWIEFKLNACWSWWCANGMQNSRDWDVHKPLTCPGSASWTNALYNSVVHAKSYYRMYNSSMVQWFSCLSFTIYLHLLKLTKCA